MSSLPGYMASNSTYHEPDCEKYCVFRLRQHRIAVLADAVREVALRPEIAPVPGSDPLLAGLIHMRNEFLPVVRLESPTVGRSDCDGHILVLNANDGPWAILVDRVLGLLPLEVSMCGDTGTLSGWSTAVMGSATHENQVVQVLDVQALRRHIGEVIGRRSCFSRAPAHAGNISAGDVIRSDDLCS